MEQQIPGNPTSPARRTEFRTLSQRHEAARVRRWARAQGIEVADTGGLPRYVYTLYERDVPAGIGPAEASQG